GAGTAVGQADGYVVHVEEVLERQDGVDDEEREEQREGHALELLPRVRPVDRGGLVHLRRDGNQPGQEDDDRARDGHPGRDEDDAEPGGVLVGQDAGLQRREVDRRRDDRDRIREDEGENVGYDQAGD